ncbi:MAG: hypothetical protein JJ864_16810 [Rhizobiaceae bacterium]|nr:hypothetical protein [Rhizobiaceae bacterium]
MLMGAAAAGLLVFAGLWRTFEWIVHGRTPGSARLIPGGLAYLVLGMIIVLGAGGAIIAWVALVTALANLTVFFAMRRRIDVRRWVIWFLAIMDMAIIASVTGALA